MRTALIIAPMPTDLPSPEQTELAVLQGCEGR